MNKNTLQAISLLMAGAVFLQGVPLTAAGAKAKIKEKKIILAHKGATKKIIIRNKKKGAKYTFTPSKKKIVKISKTGVVKALKPGLLKITVKEKYRKKTRKVGTVKVQCVFKKKNTITNPSPAPAATNPQADTPTATPSMTPEATPTLSPSPSPSPTPIGPAGYEVPVGYDKANESNSAFYGTKESKTYYSTTTGKDRKVNIIVPAGYTTDKKYPVLYLLHGIGGDENEWMSGRPQYVVGNLVASGLAKEMILVIPNCRARENDAATNEYTLDHYAAFDNFINDLRDNLMPYIKENYSIAEGRENTAIAGYSMGARESLNIGLHMPETFGYIGAFSPGYGVFAYEANGVKEDGLFTEETFRLPDDYKDNTLLLINNGSSEGGENALGGTCHKVLTKNNIPHMFYVTAGGHEMKVWKHGLYNFATRIFQS
ncbi:MAG: alpha/beta hydrolase-fold protein [Eubacterium sp.]|nr:alpha/beta hydrolase-fold protein [Eubacterium sp.]